MSAQDNNAAQNEAGSHHSSRSRPGVAGTVKTPPTLLAPKSQRTKSKRTAPPSTHNTERTSLPTRSAAATAHANTARRASTPPCDDARSDAAAGAAGQLPQRGADSSGSQSTSTTAPPTSGDAIPARPVPTSMIPPRPAPVPASTDRSNATLPVTTGDGSGRAPGRAPGQPARARRLRSGELRALVAETLTARDGDGFTVTQLANLLRRSPGAIANAAERLCEQGAATRTQQNPKTYRSTSGNLPA